jgi:hypothetical protein
MLIPYSLALLRSKQPISEQRNKWLQTPVIRVAELQFLLTQDILVLLESQLALTLDILPRGASQLAQTLDILPRGSQLTLVILPRGSQLAQTLVILPRGSQLAPTLVILPRVVSPLAPGIQPQAPDIQPQTQDIQPRALAIPLMDVLNLVLVVTDLELLTLSGSLAKKVLMAGPVKIVMGLEILSIL